MNLTLKKWTVHSLLSLMGFVSFIMSPVSSVAEGIRNPAEYNLQDGVGLKGFDPVAVFPEGGGQALPGNLELRTDYAGVIYYFATAENQALFATNPDKYEPTYGGYCAFAMASGEKVDIQPELFTINGNRAHFFVSSRAKRNFDRDVSGFEIRADDFWKKISGEDPRY